MRDNNDDRQQRLSEKEREPEFVIQQTMLILCEQQAVRKLVEALEKKLLHLDITAEVVLFGVSQKRREGFIVLELSTFLSSDFLRWLKEDEYITHYLLYPGQPPKPSMVSPAIVSKNLAFSSVRFMGLPASLFVRQQLRWSRHHQTWFQSGATVDLH